MKKRLLFLLGVLFIGIVSAVPFLSFTNPTPADNHQTTSSTFEINSSLTNSSGLEEFIFNWDGTNYTFYNDSLVLMMNFENNSALGENDSFVRDLSIYENNGSVSGAVFNLDGKYGGAYDFFGKEKITVANSESLNITENLTISLWAKRNDIVSVKEVDAGYIHTCAITENGDAYCWGANNHGALGTGDVSDSPYPKLVLGGHNFTSISVGNSHIGNSGEHTCALDINGDVYCWGSNYYGQLGIGNNTDMSTPQLVLEGYNFSYISAGYQYTCAVNSIGDAYCWGYNNYGQLGIGNNTDMSTPQLVLGGHNFTLIEAGTEYHVFTCGINITGSAFCWGENLNGQLTTGNTTAMLVPYPISGGHNFTSISVGSSHACALNTLGSAFCWGRNSFGQVGVGNITSPLRTPQLVLGNNTFIKVTCGEHHSCGLTDKGTIYCWGMNSKTELGNGDSDYYHTELQLVLGGRNFTSISTGVYSSCGIDVNNEIYCWGSNFYGVSGNGFLNPIFPSKKVIIQRNFSSVLSGSKTSCALNVDGDVYCWGRNFYGDLGNGENYHNGIPQLVLGGNKFDSLFLGYYGNCGLNESGSAFCWGENNYGGSGIGNTTSMNTPQLVLGGHNFTLVSRGYYHTCALDVNEDVYCWGSNSYGELGNGNTTSMNTSQLVLENYNFTFINAGYNNTCGINESGSAFCWGYNIYGALGIGNTTNMNTPQLVKGGYNFTSIYSSPYTKCGLDISGNIYCWGMNSDGQLGNGNTTNMNTPQLVKGGYNFTSVSVGHGHVCGINKSGSAFCWGANYNGELGIGNLTWSISTPQLVLGGHNVTSISLGYQHGCLTTVSGELYCWGENTEGQLGDGRTYGISPNEYKTIKSILVGKSIDSFLIGETWGGTIVGVFNQHPVDLGYFYDWTNILLSYNKTSDFYLNGELVDTSDYLNLDLDALDISIGENFNGAIDEVRIFNRTLSSSDAQQIYKSNLKKINETSWEFYSSQNLDSSKTYSYSLFARESGFFYSILRNIGKYLSFSRGSRNSVSNYTNLTNESLDLNFSDFLKEGQSVQVSLSDNKNYSLIIMKISELEEKVVVNFNKENYSVFFNESKKIDLDNDDYYDLEVSLLQIYNNNYSKLNIKEIHEETPKEEEEKVKENVIDDRTPEEDVKKDKSKILYYILGIVIILVVLVEIVLYLAYHRKH